MKLTGELKDKVDKTESKVEKKDIIAQAGMELTDDELEKVAGGYCEEDDYPVDGVELRKESYESLLKQKELIEKSGDIEKLKWIERKISVFEEMFPFVLE